MKIYKDIRIREAEEECKSNSAFCAVALGNFDGLHRGHFSVISRILGRDEESAVFTFCPSNSPSGELMTFEEKAELLEKWGVDRLYAPSFEDVKDMEPEDFIRTLYYNCGARYFCCGEDFRFGKNARGDAELLSRLCRSLGADCHIARVLRHKGEKISSTRIRKAVKSGDIPLARELLGHDLGFSANVIHGNHLGGPVLGAPTINQPLPENFILPPFGVYYVLARWEGNEEWGVANVGMKPTVGSDYPISETWLPDFSGDLYGKKVYISLLKFLRPERKFNSLEELKEQIAIDAKNARNSAEKMC